MTLFSDEFVLLNQAFPLCMSSNRQYVATTHNTALFTKDAKGEKCIYWLGAK